MPITIVKKDSFFILYSPLIPTILFVRQATRMGISMLVIKPSFVTIGKSPGNEPDHN